MDDYNSAGFLAFILVGLMLVVAGLILLGDASRGGETQVAQRHSSVEIPSQPTRTHRSARF